MLARDHGHIAATVSWMGLAAMPMLSSYCSSKYGCIGTSLPRDGFPVIVYVELHRSIDLVTMYSGITCGQRGITNKAQCHTLNFLFPFCPGAIYHD